MKIGMNMLLWTNHVTEQHYPIIEKLKAVGYDGIELPLGAGDLAAHQKLGAFLDEMELGRTAVTSLEEHQNIASPKPELREAGLERLKWAIDMCEAAGIEVLCGPYHSAFAYFTRQPPTEDEHKWSIEMLRKAGEYAQGTNLIFAPEALNRFECYLVNTMEGLRQMVEAIDLPNLGGLFDTHHANIEEKSQRTAIETIGPHLKHVHISENDRGTPGKGQVNWSEVFPSLKTMGYDGWLTIEAFSMAIPEFANAINVWRDFSPTNEIYTAGIQFIRQQWEAA